ncbi:MAG: nickel pincer cofactor biosynthesis protein LarC [Elainellaceae cyanobacterium]
MVAIMTKVAYLECPTGIAGDMCLGALVHLGVPLEYLIEQLSLLEVMQECKLWTELVHRNGQQATRMHVDVLPSHQEQATDHLQTATLPSDPNKPTSFHSHTDHDHPTQSSRHLPEIERLIRAAQLPARVEAWSLAIFQRLAAAEGAVHGISPDQVHFHEVGATDAIVDIVGTCLGLDWLGIEELYCSPLPTGGGTVRAAHGLLPVPAPAVLKLWEMRQIPIYSNGINRELVTPTGAAIATTLAVDFGPPPTMRLYKVGLGAGARDLAIPNILRLWLGETDSHLAQQHQTYYPTSQRKHHHPHHLQSTHHASGNPFPHSSNTTPLPSHSQTVEETIAVLETQIDDLNPQAIGYLFEALLAAGAFDVFTQAIGMKKSRLGVLLTVICAPEQVSTCKSIVFRETTTLGIRCSHQQRTILQREIQTVETPYGPVRIKVADREPEGTITNGFPEYEDCAGLARQAGVSWQEVHRLALHAWYDAARS